MNQISNTQNSSFLQRMRESTLYGRLDIVFTYMAIFGFPLLAATSMLLEDTWGYTPAWMGTLGHLFLSAFTGFFFLLDVCLGIAVEGRRYMKTPECWINGIAIGVTFSGLFFQATGLANPRVLRVFRISRTVVRVSLTQKTKREDSVLGTEALGRINTEDTKYALGILLLLSAIGQFPGGGYDSLAACGQDVFIYLGFVILVKWKARKNGIHFDQVIGKRLRAANQNALEKMRQIPGLEDVETIIEESARKKEEEEGRKFNEIDIMVNAITLIITNLRRFISRRTFLEAKGEQVIPHDSPVAMLFTDIEGFSTMTEQLQEEIVPALKIYLGHMHQGVVQFGGDVDKFIGDALFAFYYNPQGVSASVNNAFDSVLNMDALCKKLPSENSEWGALFTHADRQHFAHIRTRFGLHLGSVVTGAIGSQERADSTLIGDHVNLTARMEALNKKYGTYVLLTDTFFEHLSEDRQVRCRKLDRVTVAGRDAPLSIYTIDLKPRPSAFLQTFQVGLELYLAGQWKEAHATFLDAQKFYPEDKPTQALVERIEQSLCHWHWMKESMDKLLPNAIPEVVTNRLHEKISAGAYQPPQTWKQQPWWSHTK